MASRNLPHPFVRTVKESPATTDVDSVRAAKVIMRLADQSNRLIAEWAQAS